MQCFWHQDPSNFDAQLSVSFESISAAQKSMGPFDGILGFSQGASVLGYFLIHPSYNIPVQFAIFAARSSVRPHLRHLYGRKSITLWSKAIFKSKPPVDHINLLKNHAISHHQLIVQTTFQIHTKSSFPHCTFMGRQTTCVPWRRVRTFWMRVLTHGKWFIPAVIFCPRQRLRKRLMWLF